MDYLIELTELLKYFCWILYIIGTSRCILKVLPFGRLRVVPHFSSGIVERAKRERAWKSPHAIFLAFFFSPPLLGSGTNLLKTGNSKTLSANDKSWQVDAEGGEGQCSWLRDPTKMTIVGYEPQQKYNRTPVSIQDKFKFCHRAPMGIENEK